jgi:lipopolysaccharide export system protein LptA
MRWIVLATLVLAGAAQAQQFSGLGMSNPNAPIDVTADNFAADAKSNTAVYSGNVLIRQGEVRMRADAVRIAVADNKPDKIYAKGNIVVDAPSGVATGDDGIYDVNPRVVTLTGRVVLTRDKNVMSGTKLVVNLLSGVATLSGGTGKAGRVHGIFTPATLQNGKN